MGTRTVILCGGTIDFYSLPLNTNTSNSMIPINGKPVISWILEDLIQKEIHQATIVLREKDQHLLEFLERVFKNSKNSIEIDLVFVTEGGTILDSLAEGLNTHNEDSPVRVILGDTLIRDSFKKKGDLIYIQEVDDSYRWCLAVLDANNRVVSYLDKMEHVASPHYAVCGYYQFSDGKLLKACVNKALKASKDQMSDLLSYYGKKKNVYGKFVNKWLDFGNIDNLVKAKQELLQSRFFNSLSIDPNLNTITKVSTLSEKLENELNWYLHLPVNLQVLTPRIVSSKQIKGKLNLVQEYYGYPTLSELYLYSDLHPETWISILKKLLNLHHQFCSYTGELSKDNYRKIYIKKTFERLESLKKHSELWQGILSYDQIIFNGKSLINLNQLLDRIVDRAEQIIKNSKSTIIHGDFCFSNILYDINGQIIRLIDPRGSFGAPGIFGDPRYDISKLRHSINGQYDYLVSDLFELKHEGYNFESRIFLNKTAQYLATIFDKMIAKVGYDTSEIKFIEALLFISMLPLHQDKPQRQKMMYLHGLQLLNEIFLCE